MTDTMQKKPLTKLAERLEGLGDELRVRAHLASMEAKDAWDRAHLERVTGEIATVRDEAKVQMHLASLDAKDAWSKIEKRLDEVRGKAGMGADQVLHDVAEGITRVARAIRGEPNPPPPSQASAPKASQKTTTKQ